MSYNNLLHLGKVIWAQKAGLHWRTHMDYNTNFFTLLLKSKGPKMKLFVYMMRLVF